ncbi:ANTAR domain-containing protein [Rhodococcus sp. 2H158]
MREQWSFARLAERVVPEASATPHMLLDTDLRIRAVNTALEKVALRERDDLLGRYVYEAFPDNPGDPDASGTRNLATSLERAMRSRRTHNMWVQRYDIADPLDPDRFVPRVWSPVNSPVVDGDSVLGVVQTVEDITELDHTLDALSRAIAAGDAVSAQEQMHALRAFGSALPRYRQAQRALATENRQLHRALETRDAIGQAKGILMERHGLTADGAFELLKKVSQQSNIPLATVARRLVGSDATPSTAPTGAGSNPAPGAALPASLSALPPRRTGCRPGR